MPTKKKARKTRKSVTKNRNMVLYVEDSTMKVRIFKDAGSANKFAEDFKRNNPDPYSGYWVDLLVTNIKGEITSLDSLEVSEA